MPSFITPARLAALVGVLTGLAAAITAALNVLPQNTPIARAIQMSVGVIGTAITVIKFLEGQAGWEQLQAANHHDRMTQLQAQQHSLVINGLAAPPEQPAQTATKPPEPSEPTAELPDEVPLNTIDEAGVVVNEANPETGEPQRLYA